jgi:hypothetical protein
MKNSKIVIPLILLAMALILFTGKWKSSELSGNARAQFFNNLNKIMPSNIKMTPIVKFGDAAYPVQIITTAVDLVFIVLGFEETISLVISDFDFSKALLAGAVRAAVFPIIYGIIVFILSLKERNKTFRIMKIPVLIFPALLLVFLSCLTLMPFFSPSISLLFR